MRHRRKTAKDAAELVTAREEALRVATEALANARSEAAARKSELEKLEAERQALFKELDAGDNILSPTSLAATWGLGGDDVAKAGLDEDLRQMFVLYESCRHKAATYKGVQAAASPDLAKEEEESMEVDALDEENFNNHVRDVLGPEPESPDGNVNEQQAAERALRKQKLREVWATSAGAKKQRQQR